MTCATSLGRILQICGTSNARCNPVPYPVEYHAGVAIQYFGDVPAPNSNCTDNTGAAVPCTRDCEVLGVGLPTITLANPNDPFGGVNVTHFSVPAAQNDPFQCAYDPSTGAPKERTVTVQVRCGRNLLVKPQVVSAGECGGRRRAGGSLPVFAKRRWALCQQTLCSRET